MNYQVTIYASFNMLTTWQLNLIEGYNPELPEEAYLQEEAIMDQVQGEYQGSKSYYVPVANMPKLLNLVAEFNSREDKTYIMNLEVYNVASNYHTTEAAKRARMKQDQSVGMA